MGAAVSSLHVVFAAPSSSHFSPAAMGGPSHQGQSFMNFSNVGPSHGPHFFMTCSSVGAFIRVQSFRSRLLQHGSPVGSQVLPEKLLQRGLLSPWGHRFCQEPAPARASHGVTASFRCLIHAGRHLGRCLNLLLKEGSDQTTHSFIETHPVCFLGQRRCTLPGKWLPAFDYPHAGKLSPYMQPDPLLFRAIASCPYVSYHAHKPESDFLGMVQCFCKNFPSPGRTSPAPSTSPHRQRPDILEGPLLNLLQLANVLPLLGI